MSDGLAAVMSRIAVIRSAMGGGAGGVLGVPASKPPSDSSFERFLDAASNGAAERTGAANGSVSTDPLERIGLRSTTRSSDASGPASADWPEGLPEEAEAFRDEFIAASQATGVPLRVLLAVAWAESAFDPGAESGVGAQGMMQLMPGTAAGLGVDPSDPAQNIMGGARYLAAQYQNFGSWELAFAAYNAGPGAVQQYGGVPPYRETENYIAVIGTYLDRLGGVGGPAAAAAASALSTQQAAGTPAPAIGEGGGTGPVAGTAQPALGAGQPAISAAQPTMVDPATLDASSALAPLDLRPAALGGLGDGTAPLSGAAAGDAAARAARLSAGLATPTGAADATFTANAATLPDRLAALVQRGHGDGGSLHRVTVRLDPPDLGSVQVIFELRGDQVHLVVRPERAEGGQLLQSQRDRIATALANSGFELSGFDVSSGRGDAGADAGRQPAGSRAYRSLELEPATDVRLAVDRELRL
ncbi:MAG: transglycosylase SLT domain-containing protein [Acidimicrobiales bacterium]